MDGALDLLGLVGGLGLALWAMRVRGLPWRRAWVLMMGVFGITAGIAVVAWSLSNPSDLGCSDLGVLVGFSSSATVNGECVGRWDAPAAHAVLGIVMAGGSALGLFLAARPLASAGRGLSPGKTSLLLYVAAALALSRLVVEVSQEQYNLLALLPPLAFLSLARDHSREAAVLRLESH